MKPDLDLRRVNVHIDTIRRQLDEQEGDRLTTDHQQAAISFREGVHQRAVLNPAAVQEQILMLARGLRVVRMPDVAPHPDAAVIRLDRNQVVGEVTAEEELQSVKRLLRCGEFVHRLVVVPQHHVKSRVRQCHPRELLADVTELGGDRLQKLATDRRVLEEVSDLNLSPKRAAALARRSDRAEINVQLHPMRLVSRTRPNPQSRDFGHRRESLAAKAHRLDIEQIVRTPNLARRVRCHRQQEVVRMNPFAVIDNPQ